MTVAIKPSVGFGVDWAEVSPEVAAKVPLVIADSCGGSHIVKNQDGNTPLALAAAYSNNGEVITNLLAKVSDEVREYENLIEVAVRHDNVAVIDTLMGNYDVNIYWVVRNVRSVEMAEAIARESEDDFLAHGEDETQTPLQCAVFEGNAAAVSGFINVRGFCDAGGYAGYDYGWFCPAKGASILHFAVLIAASKEVVVALIDCGAEVNHLDESGNTPLNYAEDEWDIAVELRKAGGYTCNESTGMCFGVNWKTATPADIAGIDNDARGGLFGRAFGRPIDWAVRFSSNPEVIDALVAKGADVKGLVMLAVENNPRPGIIRALANAGADVNAHGILGRDEVITFVQDRGENYEILWAPLHYAVHTGNAEVVACLVQAGADVNNIVYTDGYDRLGETPLDFAKGGADSDIGKMLVAAGAVSAADVPDKESKQ